MPRLKRQLTVKQAAFVQEYLKDLNATAAYVRAGYSAKCAHHHSSTLMSHEHVKAAIAEAMAKRKERVQLEADTVIRELMRIALVDLGDVYDDKGNLRPIGSMPEDVRRAIAGIDTDELVDGQGENRTFLGVTRKVRMWDKLKALELLGKHLRMFVDVQEVNVTVALADRLKAARERAKR